MKRTAVSCSLEEKIRVKIVTRSTIRRTCDLRSFSSTKKTTKMTATLLDERPEEA